MEYKKVYSETELAEVVNWFREHMDELPESVTFNGGIRVINLKETVRLYFDIVREHKEKPTYGAQIRHLFLMRDEAMKIMAERDKQQTPE